MGFEIRRPICRNPTLLLSDCPIVVIGNEDANEETFEAAEFATQLSVLVNAVQQDLKS